MTRLRRILRVPDEPESRLQTRRGGHLVTVLPGELDVDRFIDLVTKGEQTDDPVAACDYFERALRTWRGRALENVTLGQSLEAEATRLEAHRERVYEQYLQARLTFGQHADVLPELRALLLCNPLRERMAGMLMIALHRSGQRTEALTVFRQTRNRLVEELGVEPGGKLRDLHQRLLAARYPDGQLFLDLHGHIDGVDPLDPQEALELMLRALGVPANRLPAGTEARAGMYRSLLAHRRMLVVLDNAHSEAQVSPLLPGSGASRTLITSRRRLTGLLHQAHSLSIDVLPLADAVSLFTRISTPQRLSAEPPELVEEIVELCGRLPLAIRLAGVRLRDRPFWTLRHIRQRLGDLRWWLSELFAGEHSVAAAFNLSVAGLDPDRRRVLEEFVDAHLVRQTAPDRYELHNLMRAFILERAQAEDQQDVRSAMRRLLDFYLHTVDACDRLIHPVRRRAELAPPDPLAVPLRFADVKEALAWCDSVRVDIPQVIKAAEHHGLLTHACQVPLRLEGYFDLREHWSDGTAAYEAALNSARMLHDQEVECELLLGLAFGWAQQQHHERAIAYYEATIKVCQEIDNRYIEGFAAMGLALSNRRLRRFDKAIEHHQLDHLGNTYRDLDMLDEAIDCYQQACEHSERAGNTYVAGRFLINLGQAHLLRDQYEEAAVATKRALTMCANGGDRHGEAYALTALGMIQAGTGECEQAMVHLVTAQRILIELNDDRTEDVRAYLADIRNGNRPSK